MFKAGVPGAHQTRSGAFENGQWHEFAREEQVNVSIAVIVGPQRVGYHPHVRELSADGVRCILENTAVVNQDTATRCQRIRRRHHSPSNKQVEVTITVNISGPYAGST